MRSFFYHGELDHPVCKAVTYRQRSNKNGLSKRNRWRSRHESQRSLGIFSQSTTHCCGSNGSFSSSWDFTGSWTPYGVQRFESTTLHPTFDIQVRIVVYAMTAVVRRYNVSCWFTVGTPSPPAVCPFRRVSIITVPSSPPMTGKCVVKISVFFTTSLRWWVSRILEPVIPLGLRSPWNERERVERRVER
jgi:hypothetical protein